MTPKRVKKVISDVVWGSKRIYGAGLVEFGEGNVSSRVGERDEMIITPSLNRYDKMSARDVVHIGFDGTMLGGRRDASSEYRLHAALYRSRKNIKCVIHTHSPYATALSVARKPIPVILEEMIIFLGGGVEVAEYAIANTEAVGVNALRALKRTNAVLLSNHGIVSVGRDMEKTVKAAQLVEKMAKVYVEASNAGNAFEVSSESEKKFRIKFEKDYSTY